MSSGSLYTNTNTAHLSALRTQSLPDRIQDFVNHRIQKIGDETIVKAIRQEAVAKNLPTRYINNIQSDFDGTYLWIWVDFKGKKREPLDLFFEEGTKDHKIIPIRKKALAFWEKGKIGIVTGIRKFSKGHWVSGIEARHVFHDGLKKGYPEFKKRFTEELERDIRENMLFG